MTRGPIIRFLDRTRGVREVPARCPSCNKLNYTDRTANRAERTWQVLEWDATTQEMGFSCPHCGRILALTLGPRGRWVWPSNYAKPVDPRK